MTGNELKGRWTGRMPRFFRQLVKLCASIITVVFAINSGVPALGGTLHEWWTDVYTYIISVCIGVIMTCKMTVAGGYKEVDPDKAVRGDMETGYRSGPPDMSDVETVRPGDGQEENQPTQSI